METQNARKSVVFDASGGVQSPIAGSENTGTLTDPAGFRKSFT